MVFQNFYVDLEMVLRVTLASARKHQMTVAPGFPGIY